MTQIRAALEGLLGAAVCVSHAEVTDDAGLTPEEERAITRAIPKRRAEFAAGRRAAREALSRLGHAPCPIAAGADRGPVWPAGVAGSITHDAGLALAAVARAEHVRGLGIDLAPAEEFPEGLRRAVLFSEAERALDGLAARAAFSAKEALYKALAPEAGFVFGFEAAEVGIDLDAGRFEARLTRGIGAFAEGARFGGGLALCEGRLVAGLVVPPRP